MDDLINSLMIKPNELIDLFSYYDSLPDDSIIKDSLGLSINSIISFINIFGGFYGKNYIKNMGK